MRSQPTSTSGRRLLALVVCALLLGAASVGLDAATAHAATVGPQELIPPPHDFPIEFAGRAWSMGQPIPAGHVVVRRRVGLLRRERRKITFTCPLGTVALEPGVGEQAHVGFMVRDLAQFDHSHRRFQLSVFRVPSATARVAVGRVYVLCGPRSEG